MSKRPLPNLCSVVRLRPSSAEDDGYTQAQLTEFARLLTGKPEQSSRTFSTSLDSNPLDPTLRQSFAGLLLDAVMNAAILIIDMNYDRTVPRGFAVSDILVADGLLSIRSAIRPETRVIILVEALPVTSDEVYALLSESDFAENLCFIDANGKILGQAVGLKFDRLITMLRPRPVAYRGGLADGTVRRRGVFAYGPKADRSYYLYRYVAQQSCHDALISLLIQYIAALNLRMLVYDSTSAGSWFQTCVQSATLKAGILPLDVASREAEWDRTNKDEASRTQHATDILQQIDDLEACFVVAAYKSGRTLLRLADAGGVSVQNTRILALYLDTGDEGPADDDGGLTLRHEAMVGGHDVAIDYLLAVPVVPLSTMDWRVRCARLLDEIEGVDETDEEQMERDQCMRDPYRVALWSLFSHYGAGLEEPLPRSRPAVMSFPRLPALDPWDAHWLAETFVSRAANLLGCSNEGMLVVVPVETEVQSGAHPISQSLRKRLNVPLLAVPRKVIERKADLSPKAKAFLKKHSGLKTIVLDESSITHKTLNRLGELVRDYHDHDPDLYATVVNLGGTAETSPSPLLAFAEWAPLRLTKGDNGDFRQ
jgi:hypothetical protein